MFYFDFVARLELLLFCYLDLQLAVINYKFTKNKYIFCF